MKTILIADDEEYLRTLIRTTLANPNQQIIEASNGNEALSLIASHNPDLLILDWIMPGKTGIQIIEELRQNNAANSAPVILLTARSQASDRSRANSLKVDAYLVKPFSPLELLNVVDRLLEGQR